MPRAILFMCLNALLSSCAGSREQTMPAKQCIVAQAAACRGCRVACPAGQTPQCVAGQANGSECTVPASCTCAMSTTNPM
jgi:hypothetical protein